MVGRAGEGVHLGDTGVDVRIKLKRTFRKGNWVTRTGLILLRIVRLGGLLEWGNEGVGYEKCGKLLD
jgi:hypothetical protein